MCVHSSQSSLRGNARAIHWPEPGILRTSSVYTNSLSRHASRGPLSCRSSPCLSGRSPWPCARTTRSPCAHAGRGTQTVRDPSSPFQIIPTTRPRDPNCQSVVRAHHLALLLTLALGVALLAVARDHPARLRCATGADSVVQVVAARERDAYREQLRPHVVIAGEGKNLQGKNLLGLHKFTFLPRFEGTAVVPQFALSERPIAVALRPDHPFTLRARSPRDRNGQSAPPPSPFQIIPTTRPRDPNCQSVRHRAEAPRRSTESRKPERAVRTSYLQLPQNGRLPIFWQALGDSQSSSVWHMTLFVMRPPEHWVASDTQR